jgi:hypothetical protein
MRNLLLLSILVILSISTVSAQDRVKKNSKGSTLNGKDDDCMLNASFDVPLEIGNHENMKKKVSHKSNDYIQFNQNGTYVESIDGVQSSGTWSYNYSKHEVTIVCNGTRTYKVSKNENGTVNLNSTQEGLKLNKRN